MIDVRAQAGFVSEVGQFLTLPGSGKDNVKYLSALSNHNQKGSWWFIVGPLSIGSEIVQPDDRLHQPEIEHTANPTCATHGLRCHTNAICVDNEIGFCCKCRDHFYGNGFNCLQSDQAVRVAGRLHGKLGDEEIDTQIQAYVSMQDGRSYTAVTSLSPTLGFQLQVLQLLAGPIGFLFAKPTESSIPLKNGYQLTGGKFNHTSTILFHGSDKKVVITQRFIGMNAWDQLEVDIEVNGDLPDTSFESTVKFPDLIEEFVYSTETSLRSIGTISIQVNDAELSYSVIQQVQYFVFLYN